MEKIKDFFSRYSYDSVKMLLDQVVLAFFGFGLTIATLQARNETLMLIAGVGSAIFYLAMIYSVAWKMGTTDRPIIDMGHRKFNPLTGTLTSLVANIPNLAVAITIMINNLFGDGSGISGAIGRFLNGMYHSLMHLIKFDGKAFHMCLDCEACLQGTNPNVDYLHACWWIYFVLIIPAVLVSTVAYIMGAKGKMFTKLMVPDLPASDRPTRKEVKERKEEERRKEEQRSMDHSQDKN
ncbi:MAG: hypothetical protein E7661_09795 [Ruminococcaceae bacterium]|nr:hypothetical protein [Oscillospiraceae bacterium]